MNGPWRTARASTGPADAPSAAETRCAGMRSTRPAARAATTMPQASTATQPAPKSSSAEAVPK